MIFMTMASGYAVAYSIPATEQITATAAEGDNSDASYIWNTDGTIQEQVVNVVGSHPTTTSASSPWSNDPAETGVGKYVRLVYLGGDADRRTDLLGNGFVELNVQRIFTFNNPATSGPYSSSPTYTVDLSLDGSTVYDTQTLTVTLENQGP
jgi:hypothetical protein